MRWPWAAIASRRQAEEFAVQASRALLGAPQGDRLRFDKQAPGVIDAVQEIWPTQRGEVFIDGPSGALPVPVVIDD